MIPQPRAPAYAAPAATDVERRFLSAVYRWMTLGLVVTAAVAWLVGNTEAGRELLFQHAGVFIGLMVAELVLVMVLSAAVNRLSAAVAGLLFVLYAALNGVTFSLLLFLYQLGSIAAVFAISAGVFAAMSIYGATTRKDLTGWRTFLFMGLIGVVIASVVNIFIGSSAISFVMSCAAVVVFTGLTAYDTQKLRVYAAAGGTTAAMPVTGALMLYLDFVNLFLALLRLFGRRR